MFPATRRAGADIKGTSVSTPTIDQYVKIDKYHAPQWLGDRAPRRFHVMVKPAGSTCNLDCTYCFYLSKETLPDGPGAGQMDDEVLERFIRQYIEGVTAARGRVFVAGRRADAAGPRLLPQGRGDCRQKHRKPGQRIENDLQTNGTLLDEEWARFLKEHHFLVGLSIDGPREIHDRYRITKRGGPTFDKVLAAAKMLQRFGVPFNTLTCVNRFNASRPLDVYRFLRRELGSTYLQFIPIVEIKGFETTAPHTWDPARLPIVGSPQARPGHAGIGGHRLVRRPRGLRLLSLQGLGRVARPRFRQGAGQSLRDARGPAHGDAVAEAASTASSAARAWRSSTTAASTRATTTSTPSTGWATSGNAR